MRGTTKGNSNFDTKRVEKQKVARQVLLVIDDVMTSYRCLATKFSKNLPWSVVNPGV